MSQVQQSSVYWADATLDALGPGPAWGYRPGGPPATEPTALVAMALACGSRPRSGRAAAYWLADTQNPDGSLGPAPGHSRPGWPTALAVAAWFALKPLLDLESDQRRIGAASAEGVDWLLRSAGRSEPRVSWMGHDSTLVGWPWVDGTHSWLEPTAWGLLALRASGQGDHPRAREAARLLLDRRLPDGGWNYGNTQVLGRDLRPQVAPTGLALLALLGEPEAQGRLTASLDYLHAAIARRCAPISLALAVLGLAAQGQPPADALARLAEASEHERLGQARSPQLALLALAGLRCRPGSEFPQRASPH